jgi:hypothetical protein
MLHDLELEDSPLANDIYTDFQNDRETTYYPYWRPQPQVALHSDHSKVSYYLNRGSKNCALVVAGNLEFEPDRIELDLTKLFPGRAIRVRELLSGQSMDVKDGIVKSDLAGYHCLVLRVETGSADVKPGSPVSVIAPVSFTVKEFNKADWSVNAEAPGVKVTYGKVSEMVLKSTAYQAAAVAEFKPHTLGRNGTIILKMKGISRLMLHIGPVTLQHDYDWQMPGPMNGWNVGTIYQVPVSAEKDSTLVLTLTDGIFNAILDGKVLVKEMRFDLAESGNKISLQTWAGDSVTVNGVEISTKPVKLFEDGVVHPVL